MNTFLYSMPVDLFFGEMSQYAPQFEGYGQKALIVTGKSSKKNGSLDDVINVLNSLGKLYTVFDQVEENPSIENVEFGAKMGIEFGAEFVIGIGGGSPLDAAKAIAILIANPNISGLDLYKPEKRSVLPILAIPTTAGTGSEVTPFSILTNHQTRTKASISQSVFPQKAFLNGKYMMGMSDTVTLSTAVDALTHLIEGYLSTMANFISDRIAESGFIAFGECMEACRKREFDLAIRNKLLLTSVLGGIVIAQAKTSIPHGMGYTLTYEKGISHGFANGVLMYEYLMLHKDKEKVDRLIRLMNLESVGELKEFFKNVIQIDISLSKEEILNYSKAFLENKAKLKNHPYEVSLDDIIKIYENI